MQTLPSGLPEAVSDDEELARFLIQSSLFNAVMAKPAAFLPNPKDRETSVSRHGPTPVDGLWELGMAAAGSRTLHGAVFVKAGVTRSFGLTVASDEPPQRHAVIRNWPWDGPDPEFEKARRKEMAAQLAAASGKPLLK